MSNIVQEKFQVTYPDYDSKNEEDVQGWCTDMEARAKKGTPGREGKAGGDSDSRFMNNAMMTLTLPPGMDIEDQEFSDIRRMGINTVGNYGSALAEGDRTQDLHPVALRKGFDRKKLLQTDDQYTREHNDAFYDDVGGFVERNNVLDRL